MMKQPYSIEELRWFLKMLNISMATLGQWCGLTRQAVSNLFNGRANDNCVFKHRLLFTYIINDYITNDLNGDVASLYAIVKARMDQKY